MTMEDFWANSTIDSDNSTESFNSTSGTFVNPFNQMHIRVTFCILYSLTFVCCIFGNSLVLFIIIRNARMRTHTNFFLANLAAADFCVGVFCVFPNLSIYISPIWRFGRAMCKIYYFIHYMSLTFPILLLTVISVERYVAILYPLKARQLFTFKRLRAMQLVIWLLLTAYNLPHLIDHDTLTIGNNTYCYMRSDSIKTNVYVLANIIVWYVIPLLVLICMYFKIATTLWRRSSGFQSTNPKETAKQLERNRSYDDICDDGSHTATPNSGGDSACRLCPIDEDSFQRDGVEMIDMSQQRSLINHRMRHLDSTISEPLTQQECLSENDGQTEGESNSELYSMDSGVESHCYTLKSSLKERQSNRDSLQRSNILKETVSHSNNARFGPITTATTSTANHHHPGRHHQIDRPRINTQKFIESRKKVIVLLIMIISSFAVLALPYHIRSCLYLWVDTTHLHSLFSPICYLLYYANSGLNPVLYALLSENFRKCFRDSFKCISK